MKPIILKNDKMTIEFDQSLAISNLSITGGNGEFPSYKACKHQMGIWSETKGLEWLNHLNWNKPSYFNQENVSLYAQAKSEKYQLSLNVEDFIHSDQKIYLRKLTINSESRHKQKFKLFFEQDFYGTPNETIVYSLRERSVYHENEGRYTLFNGSIDNIGIVQCSTCLSNEKTLVNLENGKLSFNPISSGQVKSVFSLETSILPFEIKNVYYWMIIGNSLEEVNGVNSSLKNNPEWLIQEYIGQKNTSLKHCYIGK
ncbi:hypothetical protein [Bacillus sp. Marseille-P3661]|uniref:hypothetical protein n=1 Tax=Bacillus sp. Marseille-P3661 TaxID=1936234 RepID=UPI002155449F|nr:hypothetical protein [Bacillus sp. Marseille-P3661]